jgi:hypothetical protein
VEDNLDAGWGVTEQKTGLWALSNFKQTDVVEAEVFEYEW